MKLITVISRPNIDIAHPVQVTIFNDNGLDPLWFMSRSKAKFVKWVHLHLMVPWNAPGNVSQPSFAHARRKILVKIIRKEDHLQILKEFFFRKYLLSVMFLEVDLSSGTSIH